MNKIQLECDEYHLGYVNLIILWRPSPYAPQEVQGITHFVQDLVSLGCHSCAITCY